MAMMPAGFSVQVGYPKLTGSAYWRSWTARRLLTCVQWLVGLPEIRVIPDTPHSASMDRCEDMAAPSGLPDSHDMRWLDDICGPQRHMDGRDAQ